MVYTVQWTGAGGISKVKVHFSLISIAAAPTDTPQLPLTQTFDVVFHQASGDQQSVKFSGNPGYIVGEPVRAGILTYGTYDVSRFLSTCTAFVEIL